MQKILYFSSSFCSRFCILVPACTVDFVLVKLKSFVVYEHKNLKYKYNIKYTLINYVAGNLISHISIHFMFKNSFDLVEFDFSVFLSFPCLLISLFNSFLVCWFPCFKVSLLESFLV